MKLLILCAVIIFSKVLAVCADEVIVCPDGYPATKDPCVRLHQLLTQPNLIISHTIVKFVPATFKLNSVISIANVSNISITATTASVPVNITCLGDNSGLLIQHVSGITVKNINFINCGAAWNFSSSYDTTCVIGLVKCANILVDNLKFIHAVSYGVFATDVYGKFTVSNSLFTYSGTGIGLQYDEDSPDKFSTTNGQPIVTISNCNFHDNHIYDYDNVAVVITVAVFASPLPLKLHIIDVTVTNNTKGTDVSDVFFWSFSPVSNHIILERYQRTNNTIIGSVNSNTLGASDFFYTYDGDSDENTTTVEILDCIFMNNVYGTGDHVDSFSIDINLYSVLFFYTNYGHKPHVISIRNTTIDSNVGKYGSALYFEVTSDNQRTDIQVINCTIANHTVFSSDYYKKGVVFLKKVSNLTVYDSNFINNSGTGLLLENSDVTFSGTNVFKANRAFNGGGIALYQNSDIWISQNATLKLEENMAENVGGGLYVSVQPNDLTSTNNLCFLTYSDYATLLFSNNSASTAGNDIYGGNLYTCSIVSTPGWIALEDILNSLSNYTIDLTSDPIHVCDCSGESTENCMNIEQTINTVWTYPGRQFNLSLLAVGLVINGTALSGVSTAIYASLLSASKKPAVIPSAMRVQSSQRICSNLTYRIDTSNDHEVMVLAVNDDESKIEGYLESLWLDSLRWKNHTIKLMLHDLLVPAYVEVYFYPCPVGFELSPSGECACSAKIEDFVTSCSIDTLQLQTKPLCWIGMKWMNDSEQESSVVYLTHQHCPFDYCKTETFGFSLEEPDAQCSHHRSGILCGGCEPGYSLILGSTECRQCTNRHLLLLFVFAFAGIGLIVFLSLTNMTVAAGTINGLLFYANILTDNKATFFPMQTSDSFLSVFTAWLSLDLGISTCFFDGLDAYVYTWLQLSFPIYIWLLAFIIIIAARHVTFISKICGSNIVPVLATLFLLSYTKLLEAIITSLSFAVVEVSNGEQLFVWLKDGNVLYLQGKHIALFITNFLFLLILLSYTLSIVFGPWLQRKTHHRALCWVARLKPLLDAYFGPLKDQYRYWTGVLLLSRIILGLVSAINVLGDDSINLLAIIIVSSLLLWRSGIVYKHWALSLLNSFFFLNLVILSSVSLFNRLSSGESQHVAVGVSVGATIAVFFAILLYHCFIKMKEMFIQKFKAIPVLNRVCEGTNTQDSDNDILSLMDAKDD